VTVAGALIVVVLGVVVEVAVVGVRTALEVGAEEGTGAVGLIVGVGEEDAAREIGEGKIVILSLFCNLKSFGGY
jgi:hypothetical protein